jgi:hypothetical protein
VLLGQHLLSYNSSPTGTGHIGEALTHIVIIPGIMSWSESDEDIFRHKSKSRWDGSSVVLLGAPDWGGGRQTPVELCGGDGVKGCLSRLVPCPSCEAIQLCVSGYGEPLVITKGSRPRQRGSKKVEVDPILRGKAQGITTFLDLCCVSTVLRSCWLVRCPSCAFIASIGSDHWE